MYDEIIKDVLSLTFKLFPLCAFPFCISSLIKFIKYFCTGYGSCRNPSTHNNCPVETVETVELSDCQKWVKEFEEREDISIYG